MSSSINTRQLPLRLSDSYGGTRFVDLTHSYDQNGNLIGRLDDDNDGSPDETRSMGYDNRNRLTYTDAPGLLGTASYHYDPLDNLREIDFAGGARTPQTDTYYYDSLNRLDRIYRVNTLNQSQTVDYGHDARGNMTLRGGQSHGFDRANRMTWAIAGGPVETYRYDGHGRRTGISRTGNRQIGAWAGTIF